MTVFSACKKYCFSCEQQIRRNECAERVKKNRATKRKHTTHYACVEIINRDGGKAACCYCTEHQCKPIKHKNGTEIIKVKMPGVEEIILVKGNPESIDNTLDGGTIKHLPAGGLYKQTLYGVKFRGKV